MQTQMQRRGYDEGKGKGKPTWTFYLQQTQYKNIIITYQLQILKFTQDSWPFFCLVCRFECVQFRPQMKNLLNHSEMRWNNYDIFGLVRQVHGKTPWFIKKNRNNTTHFTFFCVCRTRGKGQPTGDMLLITRAVDYYFVNICLPPRTLEGWSSKVNSTQ